MTQTHANQDRLPNRRTLITAAAATLVGGAGVSTLLAADQEWFEPPASNLCRQPRRAE